MSDPQLDVLEGQLPQSIVWWIVFGGSIIGGILILGLGVDGLAPAIAWVVALFFLELSRLSLPMVSVLAAVVAGIAGAGFWSVALALVGFFVLSGFQMVDMARGVPDNALTRRFENLPGESRGPARLLAGIAAVSLIMPWSAASKPLILVACLLLQRLV